MCIGSYESVHFLMQIFLYFLINFIKFLSENLDELFINENKNSTNKKIQIEVVSLEKKKKQWQSHE